MNAPKNNQQFPLKPIYREGREEGEENAKTFKVEFIDLFKDVLFQISFE